MVFPGHFSTGCLRCRQRKIKCDETRPSCRRCSIYGKPCTGYTDRFQFSYQRSSSTPPSSSAVPPGPGSAQEGKHQERRSTQRRRASQQSIEGVRQQPQQQPQQQTQQQTQQQQQQPTIKTEDGSCGLVRAPEPCYDHISLFYFVRRFVSPNPEDGFPGHLSFLPNLYDSYSHGVLEVATLSVAQMAAYNTFGGERFRLLSCMNYGRAIRMLQGIIASESQATDDKVIMSVLLLCMLKDISGEGSGDPGEHAPGLFYLIEKRGPEQIATSRGAELLFLALIRLQVYSFLYGHDTYGDPGAIATVWGAFDLLLRAMAMMARTLSLRHRLLADRAFFDPAEQTSLIQTCSETLDDFHLWDVEAAAYWQSMFKGRGTPTALGEVASGTTHYDVETACTMILIRSARLILLMSMIAHHHGQQQSDNNVSPLAEYVPFLEMDVGLAVDDMLASVPYALGDVGPGGLPGSVHHDGAAAIVIVHSIRLVASCAYLTPDQRQKAVAILARLNAGIGIRSAVCIGEEDLNNMNWAREQVFLRSRIARSLGSSPSAAVGVVFPVLAPPRYDPVVDQVEAGISVTSLDIRDCPVFLP